MADDYKEPQTEEVPSKPPQKGLLGFIRQHVDVEMWQKGWWMFALIIGTILVLFAIAVTLMSKYPTPPAS